MAKPERPRQPRRITGKWWALLLAVVVQLSFLAVLVFSVQWKSREPAPVTAELYAPPVKAPVVAPTPPPPPSPQPEPEPKPAPPPPKPAPVVEKPDPRAAEIALMAKQEEEHRKKAEAERRAEAEKKAREAKEAEEKRKADEKRVAEAKERQQRETAALRAQAEREAQQQLRAQAEREAQARAQQAADATARSKAEADWIRRIQAKVKGNVIVPADLPGNPEAIFEVVQLPTGEIIDTKLVRSSGSRAYDDAVQRAILKSSPLPRPDRTDLFQRTLTLKFRPQD